MFPVRLVVEHVRPRHQGLAALLAYEKRSGRGQARGLHVRLERVFTRRERVRVRDAEPVDDVLAKIRTHRLGILGDVPQQVGASQVRQLGGGPEHW